MEFPAKRTIYRAILKFRKFLTVNFCCNAFSSSNFRRNFWTFRISEFGWKIFGLFHNFSTKFQYYLRPFQKLPNFWLFNFPSKNVQSRLKMHFDAVNFLFQFTLSSFCRVYIFKQREATKLLKLVFHTVSLDFFLVTFLSRRNNFKSKLHFHNLLDCLFQYCQSSSLYTAATIHLPEGHTKWYVPAKAAWSYWFTFPGNMATYWPLWHRGNFEINKVSKYLLCCYEDVFFSLLNDQLLFMKTNVWFENLNWRLIPKPFPNSKTCSGALSFRFYGLWSS